MKRISEERAERIAKGHACENCGEYTFKRVSVKAASTEREESEGVAWVAEKTCGVCSASNELGIAPDGAIVYST